MFNHILTKRPLTFLLLFVLFPAFLMTAQTYTVYKVKGQAFTLKNAAAKPLKRGETVSGGTLMRINTDSEVWLIEKSKKKAVYKLRNATGRKGASVTDLVNTARKHIQTGINDINNAVIGNISVNKTPGDDFTRAGVSRVITNASGSKTMLRSMTGPDDFTMQTYRPVKVKKASDGNGMFHFSFKNESPDVLYANIILKDCTPGDMDFLLPENVVLSGEKITDLDQMTFMIPELPFPGYILILSDSPFSRDDILNEFDVETQDVSRNYVYEIIR